MTVENGAVGAPRLHVVGPPSDRRAWLLDALLYGASAVYAGGAALWQGIPFQRTWAREAVGPYAIGAIVAVIAAARRGGWPVRTTDRARMILCTVVLAGAVAAPWCAAVVLRAVDGPATHAQAETIITEEAARALVDGRNPYAVSYAEGPLGSYSLGAVTHFPYLPMMLTFGLPRAAGLPGLLGDARVWFAAAAALAAVLALKLQRVTTHQLIRILQVLVVLPTAAPYLLGGGDDVTVVALMLLAVAAVDRDRPVMAAVVTGLAAATKQIAWPLAPFLVVCQARRRGTREARRTAILIAAVVATACLPFLAWDLHAFVDDVIKFPLGLADQPTLAGSPTLGRLLVDALPGPSWLVSALLLGIVAWIAVWILVRRPPSNGSQLAAGCALVIALAILLASAGRFGYLLYPIDLFTWSLLARPTGSR
jgi:glycosyl transferase family 87